MKNRFAQLAVGLTLLAGACSSSDAETLPTLDLTTTTAEPTTTEAPTTTAPSSTTSPSTEATTTSAAEVEQFDPETAQAEIAALLEDVEAIWTFQSETPDPNDPRLAEIFAGDQLERIRALFRDVNNKGQKLDGKTTIAPYPPALLTASNQTAGIVTCRFGQVRLIDTDGSVLVDADEHGFDNSFEFVFVDGVWKVSAYGKSSGQDIPCDI